VKEGKKKTLRNSCRKGELKTKTGRNSFVAADIGTFIQAHCRAQNSARCFVTANERGWMSAPLAKRLLNDLHIALTG